MKYITVTISGIITQIAKTTDVKGYTVGLIEAFLPDENEMQKWTKKDTELWIAENNKRMEAICELLNAKEIKQNLKPNNMKQNFKLFTTAYGEQIMYERMSTDEDGEAIATTAYNSDGVRMSTKAGYEDNEKKADEEFNKIDKSSAKKWYDTMTEMIGK